MEVRVAFLPDYPLVLSLLKYRDVGAFLKKKKMRNPNKKNSLNNSIDNYLDSWHSQSGKLYIIVE